MCRTTDIPVLRFKDRCSLKIKGFYVRLLGLKAKEPLTDSLTLHYLPRIDSSSFVTLHRFVGVCGSVFGSREPVHAREGVRFEVYLGEERILEGGLKRGEGEEWRLECKNGGGCAGAAEAEVSVVVDGHMEVLSARVELAVMKRKGRRGKWFESLEVILEEEDVGDDDGGELDGDCCCDCTDGRGSSGDSELGREVSGPGPDCETTVQMDNELEGVRWAVDVGVWVVSLGVGYLASKAASKSLRRLRVL